MFRQFDVPSVHFLDVLTTKPVGVARLLSYSTAQCSQFEDSIGDRYTWEMSSENPGLVRTPQRAIYEVMCLRDGAN